MTFASSPDCGGHPVMAVEARMRKLALTVHVVSSAGWLGAGVAFLALAITGRTGGDTELVRGCHLAIGMLRRAPTNR